MILTRLRRCLTLLPFLLLLASACAQENLPSGCRPNTFAVPEADAALYLEDWGKAARLYHEQLQKDPTSLDSQAGLIRVLLGQGRIDDALRDANALVQQHPGSIVAQTILAETFLRRGQLPPATPILAKALTQDPCYARAHLIEARLQGYSGYHASAARQLAQAHALDPADEQITLAYLFSLPPAKRFPQLKDFVAKANFLNPSDREDLQSNILEGEARMNSSCTVTAPALPVTVPFIVNPVLSRASGQPTVDVAVNGKTHRMALATSSSGITFSPAAARAMGLVPVVKFTYSQLYLGGRVHFYLANIDSLRVGSVEYRNCLVTVVDELSVVNVGLEAANYNPAGVDGSIGAGFFEDFVLGVNTPAHQLIFSPIPQTAVERDSAGLLTWSNAAASNGDPVPSINGGAWGQHNRTMPANMKGWTSLVEYRDDIWIPAHVGSGPPVLFTLELAAPWPRIATSAVNQTAKIESIADGKTPPPFKGYFFEFAGLFFPINSWTSVRYDEYNKHLHLETSGTVGGEALRQLNMTINFRDNLVHFDRPRIAPLRRPDTPTACEALRQTN